MSLRWLALVLNSPAQTRTEMQVSVQVESVFMNATDYSPLK